ncbi:MAG: GNAT family N-acetyltransferase [Schleiferiaceae bacterium]|nr:GNAT family N-acetyltransferase [Schleiferiaceae bacterium]
MVQNFDYIIPPVNRELIEAELTDERFVRETNKGGNKIYFINAHNSPNTMREIGRLRELSFANAGGGTGEEVDIDKLDTSDTCYEQLIVYSEKDKEIIGGYRFIDCAKLDLSNKDSIALSTAHYFNFSQQFVDEYLPHTVELGRSWIQPKYQPHINPREGIFALDNLWDGLGAIYVNRPGLRYFFGKVTMYPDYNKEARDAVLHFMECLFPDKENLVTPKTPLVGEGNIEELDKLFKGKDYKEGMIALNAYTKDREERVPPLIKNYMSLSPTMKSFGTAINPDFGDVEETAILVTVADIYDSKKERYTSY